MRDKLTEAIVEVLILLNKRYWWTEVKIELLHWSRVIWTKSRWDGTANGSGNPYTDVGVGEDEYESIVVDVLEN